MTKSELTAKVETELDKALAARHQDYVKELFEAGRSEGELTTALMRIREHDARLRPGLVRSCTASLLAASAEKGLTPCDQ